MTKQDLRKQFLREAENQAEQLKLACEMRRISRRVKRNRRRLRQVRKMIERLNRRKP